MSESGSRPRCPFYGFQPAFGWLLETEGNRCACVIDRFAPCQMEARKETPDWDKCVFFNNPEYLGKMRSVWLNAKVFPDRENVPGGVRFSDWFRRIIGRDF